MNKEDSIDSIKFYARQKQIDDMRQYTKEYEREQFVISLVEQREEIANFKKALNEIKYYINGMKHLKDWIDIDGYAKRENDILQIIDKVLGDGK